MLGCRECFKVGYRIYTLLTEAVKVFGGKPKCSVVIGRKEGADLLTVQEKATGCNMLYGRLINGICMGMGLWEQRRRFREREVAKGEEVGRRCSFNL